MGMLRTFLALSVFYWHMASPTGHFLLNGSVAVESFYIISGYLMASTFAANYADGESGLGAFMLNRALRIYPIYYLVIALTLVFHHLSGQNDPILGYPSSVAVVPSPGLRAALIFSNVSLFGLDVFALLDKNNILLLPNNPRLLNPAWSIGSALLFYLTVPLCVRSSIRRLLLVIAAAGVLRWAMLRPGPWPYDVDPLLHYFSPARYVFFLLGVLSFRLQRLAPLGRPPRALVGMVLAILVATMAYAGFDQYVSPDQPMCWIYYGLLAASCPVLSRFRGISRVERAIGSLSLPIYLLHPLLLDIYDFYVGSRGGEVFRYIVLSTLVLVGSVAVLWAVERPVDWIRASVRRGTLGWRARSAWRHRCDGDSWPTRGIAFSHDGMPGVRLRNGARGS